ncbi:MAG: DUF167 domain-containing protein [Promethearchaeota archaeon]|nr:MAG: DUF167 domain-containing protein [Candidatus Lokiarchaeota archaeon]
MNFIKKTSESSFLLQIYVKPNSRKQKFIDEDEFLTVYLKSKPKRNKANKELLSLMKEKFNLPTECVYLASGATSQDKIIELRFLEPKSEEEVYNLLFG